MSTATPNLVHTVTTDDGVALHVGEWPADEADAPVLVFVPGLIGTHGMIGPVAQEFRGQIRAISYDPRGRGRSGHASSYGMARHAADVVAILDHLGIDRAVVGGHAMGAGVAVHVAAGHPDRVRALVLVDGGIHTEEHIRLVEAATLETDDLVRRRINARSSTWDEAFMMFAIPYFPSIDAEPHLAELAHQDLAQHPDGIGSMADAEGAVFDMHDVAARHNQRLHEVRCATLAVVAGSGLYMNAPGSLNEEAEAVLRSAVPHADWERLDHLNNVTMLLSSDGARRLGAKLLTWMRGLEPEG